ncbi:MAG: KTSC domain-containing protein [Rhodocyclaceae bacterium]|nr:MAG: KTSC domain-containing protein [Rhodocyclaceae bacterium]
MNPKLIPITNSSQIVSYAYLAATQLLIIGFKKAGSYYTYPGVPQSVVNAFAQATSHGTYLNQNIKKQYTATQITEAELDALLAQGAPAAAPKAAKKRRPNKVRLTSLEAMIAQHPFLNAVF